MRIPRGGKAKTTPLAKEIARAERERLNDALERGLRSFGADLPEFRREFFAIKGDGRRWDFAFPTCGLLVEVQGGIWQKTRTGHSSGAGILRDINKATAAACEGWRTVFLAPNHVDEWRKLEATVAILRRACRARPVGDQC